MPIYLYVTTSLIYSFNLNKGLQYFINFLINKYNYFELF